MDHIRSIVNGPQTAQKTDQNRSMQRNIREILIRNLKLLRAHQVALGRLPPDHSDRQWHALVGVPRSTIRHIEADDVATGASIDTLAHIAGRFHLEAWQLLVAEFDPEAPPSLATTSERPKLARRPRTATTA